jgi:hypothetical protein
MEKEFVNRNDMNIFTPKLSMAVQQTINYNESAPLSQEKSKTKGSK